MFFGPAGMIFRTSRPAYVFAIIEWEKDGEMILTVDGTYDSPYYVLPPRPPEFGSPRHERFYPVDFERALPDAD